jgi:hypothetical protein
MEIDVKDIISWVSQTDKLHTERVIESFSVHVYRNRLKKTSPMLYCRCYFIKSTILSLFNFCSFDHCIKLSIRSRVWHFDVCIDRMEYASSRSRSDYACPNHTRSQHYEASRSFRPSNAIFGARRIGTNFCR